MNRNAILIVVGTAIVVVLVYLFTRTSVSLAKQSPTLAPQSLFQYTPKAGPNTPVNTSGTAPYAKNGPGQVAPVTAGPSAIGAIAATSAGIATALKSIFSGNSSQTGTVAAYPGGPTQQPYDLLAQNTIPAINPAAEPIPIPAESPISAAYAASPVPPPPDISVPGVDNSALLDSISPSNPVAPPSPIVTDIGALPLTIGPQTSGYETLDFNSTPANYNQPSFPLDGGEIAT